jgi:hypothetical protein
VLSGQIQGQAGHETRVGERERVRESAGEHERAKVSLFSRFALTCWLLEAEHSEHVGCAQKYPASKCGHDHFFPKKKECKFERIHKTEDLSEAREARAREWAEDGSRSGPPVGAKTEEERE